MDAATARKLYQQAKRCPSRSQLKGAAAAHAKAERKWHVLLDAAQRGATLEEATALTDLKPRSVKHVVYKHTGSTRWPPQI